MTHCYSLCYIHQGLRRLRKIQPEARIEELIPDDYYASNYLKCDAHLKSAKVTTISSMDRSAKGTTIPASIRMKRMPSVSSTFKHMEHPSNGRIQHDLGAKRLKVKGPSILGSETSRLDY